MRTQNVKDTLILFRSSEPYGYQNVRPKGTHESKMQEYDSSNPTEIPPLGCFDFDQRPAQTDDVAQTSEGADYLRSQAKYGGWRVLVLDTQFNLSDESDKDDIVDIVNGRYYARGHGTYSASLEMAARLNEKLWRGAIALGKWDSANAFYDKGIHFRNYDFMIFEHPDVKSLDVATANNVIFLSSCIMEKIDTDRGNPEKWTIPVSAVIRAEYPNWVKPSQAALGTTIDPDTATPLIYEGNTGKIHTRLVIELTGTAMVIVAGTYIWIRGKDRSGDLIEDMIELTALDTTEVIEYTNQAYWGDFTMQVIGDLSNGDGLIAYDWDFAPSELEPYIIP